MVAMATVSMTVSLGDGNSSRLWTDSWASVGLLCHFAPDLFAAITRTGKKRSVRDGLLQKQWARDVMGALTTQVLCQFLQVWALLRTVVLDPLQADRFIWKWLSDGKYSASSTYRAFFAGSTTLLGAKELWKTKAPPRVKFFFGSRSITACVDGRSL